MGKKLVVSFPGGRTGFEIPILYFCVKCFENRGYEKVFIPHPTDEDKSVKTIYEHTKKMFAQIDLGEYEEIVFVAKSLGTQIACMLKEEYDIPASLVLLTPLQETLPYMHKENQVLFVSAGTKDRYLDSTVLQEVCERENITCYIESEVGHRMEVVGDIDRDVEIIRNVIRELEQAISV